MHLLTHDASCGEWEMPVTLQGQASGNHRPQHRTALTLANGQGGTSGEGLGELGCELGPSKSLPKNPGWSAPTHREHQARGRTQVPSVGTESLSSPLWAILSI